MDTSPISGRVTSDPLEPLPQPQTNRSVVSVEREAEAEKSPESQSRISYDLKADLTLLRQVRHQDLYILLKNKERTLNFVFRSGLRRPCRLLDNGNFDVIFFASPVSAPGAELRHSGYDCSYVRALK